MDEGRFKHRPDKMIFDKLVGMKQSPSLIARLNGAPSGLALKSRGTFRGGTRGG